MMRMMAGAGLGLPAIFAADVAATGAASWLIVCALGLAGFGLLEASLAWFLAFTALVGGAGVILGATGGLGAVGFCAVHAGILAALAAFRSRRLSADGAALRRQASAARDLANRRTPETAAAFAILLVLAALAAVSAWSQPETADALSYHLPRIGQWLVDGRVNLLPSQDDRMNFVAVVPDLVMAWLMGGAQSGFRPADLAQAIGGVMAVGATVGLARQTGLSRGASILAGALLLGMANVVVQFTASQTDLFTAGVFAASFYLWVAALRRGEGSELGGMGAGFALGSKGTIFYLSPGAAAWVAILAWRHRLRPAAWGRTLAAGLVGVSLFALPALVRNWKAYGDPLGPKEWVGALHKGARSPGDYFRKLQWNLTCTLAQVFDPQSQPPGLRAAGRAVIGGLERLVPESDPYTLYGMGRRERLQNALLHRTEPDADYVSFGIVTLVLFSAGTLAAIASLGSAEGRLVAAWGAGVALFIGFFDLMQQWHPNAFRYFVLAAPWMAVVSAWGVERLRGAVRTAVWTAVLAAAACVCWRTTADTYQAGWQAVVNPENSLTYYASAQWSEWSAGLAPVSAPLALYMPEDRAVAGFYRQPEGRRISFKPPVPALPSTAEDFVRGQTGWVIVPATLFIGREGNVAASVWLFEGDPASRFSVAAYRTLLPGESQRPVLYRDAVTETSGSVTHTLLVKTWDGRPVDLHLTNPGANPVRYQILTPTGSEEGAIPARGRLTAEFRLPEGRVSEVRVVLASPAGGETPGNAPAVSL